MELKHVLQSSRERSLYPVAKRAMDIILSAAALCVLWPILLLIALVVYLDDPSGSPLYISTRCGREGKPFTFYKFRTMAIDAEVQRGVLLACNEMDGPVFKIKDDPRITRVGRFLRRTGLDELPQLVNVLLGDMSLVGPRPPLPCEVACYDVKAWARLSVIPGLTGTWQVTPCRNAISFTDWLEMDLAYIRERNLAMDIVLLCKTFRVAVKGEGQ